MKLQVNLSGAWRDVLVFKPDRLAEVQSAADTLARAGDVPFRIDRGVRPVVYHDRTSGRWQTLAQQRR